LDGLINLRIGISILSMYMPEWLLIISLVFKKYEKSVIWLHDVKIMLVISVILLSAMIYWINLILSTEFITVAWSIFGEAELAVVSVKLLT